MSEKRFTIKPQDDYWAVVDNHNDDKVCIINGIHTEIEAEWLCDFMNEQQELIEELHISDHMGWGRAEKFEKELKQKKIYIKRLEYKVQKFKEENEQLAEENKKLRKELSDCEKFRYQVFKEMEKINELKAKLREKEEDEKLYANEIVELRKTNEEWLQFKELGGDY